MTSHAPMIAALRVQMKTLGLDGLIVPRFDAHQGEYVAPHDERLRWLTGFSGSAGMGIITHDTVAIFVDGRYTVQVRNQCPGPAFEFFHFFDSPADLWLGENIGDGKVIGFDPMLVPPVWYERFSKAALGAGVELRPVTQNPVDSVWEDQPAPPKGQITRFSLQFAGKSFADKRADLMQYMNEVSATHYIDTQPDNIAWFLNIRGNDIDYNPMTNSFILVDKEGKTSWFVNSEKFFGTSPADIVQDVEILPIEAFISTLQTRLSSASSLLIDPDFSPVAVSIVAKDKGAKIIESRANITLTKAQKNSTELNGMRDCHIRDGVAWCEFGSWLSKIVPKRAASNNPVTEREAEEKILEFRQAQQGFMFPSFNSISAASGNAAMCHYATSQTQNAEILPQHPYLLDSGGQYDTGTTDATRSFSFGQIPEGYTRAYTAVLKAFIALATLRFPQKSQGHQIDAICRRPLWDLGLDYDHGTGHGVGHCLSVHEQPQRISRAYNPVDLKEGMILSIEPGHYIADLYGIRIENLFEIIVADDGFLEFSNLTYIPIQTDMLDVDALNSDEIDWLNAYHVTVITSLSGRLSQSADNWVKKDCAPI